MLDSIDEVDRDTTPKPKKVAKKKKAAKKAAVAGKVVYKAPEAPAAKPKATRKPRAKSKSYGYQIIPVLSTPGIQSPPPINGPVGSIDAVMSDVSLAASPGDTIVIYRELKRGALKTKVSIGGK